ncbi:MAG: threonine synthase, partial [Natronospirillum sp.]
VKAARSTRRSQQVPMITLGTAHPVKFAEAVQKAGMAMPELPHHLTDLMERQERYTVLANDRTAVHEFMAGHVFGG